MKTNIFIVAVYDIVDNKRRTRIMKAMKNFGPRVQKSVFEFNITENQLNEIKKISAALIDPIEDSVRFYRICSACKEKTEILGWGEVSEDRDGWVV